MGEIKKDFKSVFLPHEDNEFQLLSSSDDKVSALTRSASCASGNGLNSRPSSGRAALELFSANAVPFAILRTSGSSRVSGTTRGSDCGGSRRSDRSGRSGGNLRDRSLADWSLADWSLAAGSRANSSKDTTGTMWKIEVSKPVNHFLNNYEHTGWTRQQKAQC